MEIFVLRRRYRTHSNHIFHLSRAHAHHATKIVRIFVHIWQVYGHVKECMILVYPYQILDLETLLIEGFIVTGTVKITMVTSFKS